MLKLPRPRFDSIYKGAWPFDPSRGVGLRLTGKPTDASALIAILDGYSCPHDVSWRIAAVLAAGEPKLTTVMAHLNFDALAIALRGVGVTIEIVEPQK